jgi:Uma2 family endonuclease
MLSESDMSLMASISSMTPEEFLRLPDSNGYELVDGKLVERHMGLKASSVGARILILIGIFLKTRPLGHLFNSEASYQCFRQKPHNVRRADVSFIRVGRFPDEQMPEGNCRIAPDLVVEVVSPNDLAYEVDEKVKDYLKAGVPLIWVVYLATQSVTVFRQASSPLGKATELSADESIGGEDVLPGFACNVAEFFA